MSGLPPGWATATLDELAAPEPRAITDGPFGSNLKTAHYTLSGPRVVRLQNIGDGRFLPDEAHISDSHFERLSKHSVEPGDILIAGLGEHLPRACVAPPGLGRAIVKADCFRVRLASGISPHFVCSMLNSPQMRAAAGQIISGIGRPRLNLAKLRSLAIPMPPASEQGRIFAAIEEEFSRIDAGDVALERVRQNLRRLRIALMQAAVLGRLPVAVHDIGVVSQQILSAAPPMKRRAGRLWGSGSVPQLTHLERESVPEHWQWSKVSELGSDPEGIVQVGPMSMRSADFAASGVPVLNVGCVQWDRIEESKLNYLPPVVAESFSRYRIQPGDVLFTRSGTVGRSAVAEERHRDWLMTFHLLRVRVDRSVCLPDYLRMVFEAAPHVRRQARGAAIGTTRAGFNTRLLAELDVPLPPVPEQSAIVQAVQFYLSQMEQVNPSAMMRGSQVLRTSVLATAFAGSLVRQNPGDEPASVLLERIEENRIAQISPRAVRTRKAIPSREKSKV